MKQSPTCYESRNFVETVGSTVFNMYERPYVRKTAIETKLVNFAFAHVATGFWRKMKLHRLFHEYPQSRV